MAIVTYGSVNAPKRKSVLQKDEEGFSKVLLGSFNVFNSVGDYYSATKAVKMIFDSSSSFVRRINNQYLKMEQGHPKFKAGDSDAYKVQRIERVDEKYVCGHIKNVALENTNKLTPASGEYIVNVVGWVKPAGPYSDSLEKFLNDPSLNGAFSGRYKFDVYVTKIGQRIRAVKRIITWDFVNEPGIAGVNIQNSLDLEDFTTVTIDTSNSDDVKEIKDALLDTMESGNESDSHNAQLAFNELSCNGPGCIYDWVDQ